jgi:hypothetical protein
MKTKHLRHMADLIDQFYQCEKIPRTHRTIVNMGNNYSDSINVIISDKKSPVGALTYNLEFRLRTSDDVLYLFSSEIKETASRHTKSNIQDISSHPKFKKKK